MRTGTGRVVVLVLVGMVALLGVLAIPILDRDASPYQRPMSEPITKVKLVSEEAAAEVRNAEQAVARAEVKATAPTLMITSASNDARARGALQLRAVDALTGEPVPHLPFLVYSERPKDHLLANGRTDDQGEARIALLPEDLIIIESLRSPPHASTLTAIWLKDGASRDVELRVLGGGTLRGRVVDDSGAPLAGVKVFLSDPNTPIARDREQVALTDDQGHFRVEAVVDRPRGIWVVDGSPRPERNDPIHLTFTWDAQSKGAVASVADGEEKELPDVVFYRPSHLAGRVLSPAGDPVAGALVSMNTSRLVALRFFRYHEALAKRYVPMQKLPDEMLSALPRERAFELLDDEALTDADGRFSLDQQGHSAVAMVITAVGETGCFDIPVVRPGEQRTDITLQLEAQTIFELELVDDAGGALDAKSLIRLSVAADLAGERQRTASLRKRATSTYLARFLCSPSDVEALEVRAEGIDAYRCQFDALNNLERVRCVLCRVEQHVVRLAVAAPPGTRLEADDRRAIAVRACLVPPGGTASGECCGLGGRASIQLAKLPAEVSVSVKRRDPYWVFISLPQGWDVPAAQLGSYGPLLADGDVHSITLPEIPPRPAQRDEKTAAASSPTAPPPDVPRPGSVVMRVVDAATREPLPYFEFTLTPAPENPRIRAGMWTPQPDDNGWSRLPCVAAWTYRAELRAAGYENGQGVSLTVVSGRENDLGTSELRPLPRIVGRVVDESGAPAQPGTRLELWGSDINDAGYAAPDADGRFSIPRRTTEPLTARVTVPGPRDLGWEGTSSEQRFSIPAWTPGREVLLTLVRSCPVLLRVVGVPDAYRGARFSLRVEAEGDGEGAARSLWPSTEPDGRLVCRVLLSPGRYRVSGSGALFSVADQVIEVTEGMVVQSFRLSVE